MNLLATAAKVNSDIDGQINAFSVRTVLVASLLLIVLVLISSKVVKHKKLKILKKPLFIMIAATILLPTFLMTGSTIYLNTVSDSKGPVHWHTDIEFWVCGQEIELRDPIGLLSNKIGTNTYHEHDDKRIHLEGVVIDKQRDASLGKFMDVTGGSISGSELVIPTNDNIFEDDFDGDKNTGDQEWVKKFSGQDSKGRKTLNLTNGQGCSESGYAEVQAFLYRFNKDNKTYTQTKLENPASYIMRDEATVPPGDCLIVEFDALKSFTDKLCQQYGVRDHLRCVEFGVSNFNPDLCNISETTNSPIMDKIEQILEKEEL